MSKAKVRVTIETEHAILKDLTPEQAKELRDILLQMFPTEPKVVREIIHERHRYPYWDYPYPGWWSITSSSTNEIHIDNNQSSSGGISFTNGEMSDGCTFCADGAESVTISLREKR